VKIKLFGCIFTSLLGIICAQAQEPVTTAINGPVPLAQSALANDVNKLSAIEATLRTTGLNGAPDSPVTNIRLVLKNVSPQVYSYVTGLVTFYDASGVRCGEGLFKSDAIAPGESVETDVPGIRVTCNAAAWRIIATNLITPKEQSPPKTSPAVNGRLVISVDGEEHPIQLDKPMVLNLGDKKRTIVVRLAP